MQAALHVAQQRGDQLDEARARIHALELEVEKMANLKEPLPEAIDVLRRVRTRGRAG